MEEEFDFFATFDMASEGATAHGTRGWKACMDAPYFKQQPVLCEVWERYRRLKLGKQWKYAKGGCAGKRFCPPAVATLALTHLAFITIWKSSTTWKAFGSDGVQGSHLTFSPHMQDYQHAWKLLDALAGRSGIHGARWPGADPAAFCHQPVARPALPAHATASSASALEALAALRAQNRELRKQARRQSASVQRRSERVMKVVAKESKRLGDLLMKSIQDD